MTIGEATVNARRGVWIEVRLMICWTRGREDNERMVKRHNGRWGEVCARDATTENMRNVEGTYSLKPFEEKSEG